MIELVKEGSSVEVLAERNPSRQRASQRVLSSPIGLLQCCLPLDASTVLEHRRQLVNMCWPKILSVTPVIIRINSFLLKLVGIISYLYQK